MLPQTPIRGHAQEPAAKAVDKHANVHAAPLGGGQRVDELLACRVVAEDIGRQRDFASGLKDRRQHFGISRVARTVARRDLARKIVHGRRAVSRVEYRGYADRIGLLIWPYSIGKCCTVSQVAFEIFRLTTHLQANKTILISVQRVRQ